VEITTTSFGSEAGYDESPVFGDGVIASSITTQVQRDISAAC